MIEYREDLRRELEALKKKAESVFRGSGRAGGIEPPAGRRPAVRPHVRRSRIEGGRSGEGEAPARPRGDIRRPSGPLTKLIPGEPVEAKRGMFYRVLAGAETIWEDTAAFDREYLDALADPFPPESTDLEPLLVLKDLRPEEACYLDLETTGLGTAPLFLVGLMYMDGGRFMVDQLFARDYTEEPSVLQFTSAFLDRFKAIVTFNGLRFDIPFLKERMITSGIGFTNPGIHIDLLPLARRIVKSKTPDHKLQTLENYLCRRKRIGDVPGSEIPDAYHEFVRTGDAADIAAVFHHNRLDLLTMAQLILIFLTNRV